MGETIQRYMDNQMGRMVPAQAGEWCHYEAAADLIESQAAELATLKQQNAEQAKRIGELEKMRVEIDDQNRVLCENNRKQSVSLGALIADTDEQRKERDTLRQQNGEQSEKIWELEKLSIALRANSEEDKCLRDDIEDQRQTAVDECERLQQQNAEQAERIGELEAIQQRWKTFESIAAQRMADEINLLVTGKVIDSRSRAADAALDWADPDFERMDTITTLRSELAELRGTAEVAKKHLETAFAEDVDLAEGTANIRLALQALAASGEG